MWRMAKVTRDAHCVYRKLIPPQPFECAKRECVDADRYTVTGLGELPDIIPGFVVLRTDFRGAINTNVHVGEGQPRRISRQKA